MATPTDLLLLGVWGASAADIWAVGINGIILHYDGSAWTPVPQVTTRNLFGIWGRAAGDAYAIGNTGMILRLVGNTWTEARNVGSGQNLRGVWGDNTGRIVTAAALLFCIAIGSFVTSEILFIKQVGLGTALAVLIDATIIRALLVPSLMEMLGRWNWWAPRPLRRVHDRLGLSEG